VEFQSHLSWNYKKVSIFFEVLDLGSEPFMLIPSLGSIPAWIEHLLPSRAPAETGPQPSFGSHFLQAHVKTSWIYRKGSVNRKARQGMQ